MQEIESRIVIKASPAAVWRELVDFHRHSEWNPFIREASGEAREGAILTIRVAPPGAGAMTFRPRVLVASPERELRWRGKLVLPGLFDGEHYFRILPRDDNSVEFVQGERFTGLLVPLFGSGLQKTRLGFGLM
ncbi:MAG: SRPBCC domain-containing protein, partial [Hyphomicrobiales bacterium]